MAFGQAESKIPATIGIVKISLSTFPQKIWGAVQVLDQDGELMEVRRFRDISPHLTPAQITGLQDFMVAMRAKAVEEIIPDTPTP